MGRRLFIIINLCSAFVLASCGKKIEETKKSKQGHVNTPVENSNDNNNDKNSQTKVDPKIKRKLLEAIEANDSNIIGIELDKQPYLEYQFDNGETPLTMAIKVAKTEIITKIIQQSKNLNLKNKKNETAIHLAIKKNNLFIINLLLSKAIDLNIKDSEGLPPIIYALNNTNEIIIKKLLTHGASIKSTDKLGRNVKTIATDYGLYKVLELISFIESNQTVNNKALNDAVKSGRTIYVDYLINNFIEYSKILKERNLLLTALKIERPEKRQEMIYKLLARGANPNNREGIPPLSAAIIAKDYHAVESLLNYKADILIEDEEGLNSLDYAANLLQFNTIKRLKAEIFSKRYELGDDIIVNSLTKACSHLPTEDDINNNEWNKYRLIKKELDCF